MIKHQEHMVAPLSAEHHRRANDVIAKIKLAEQASKHTIELIDIILDLTEHGLHFYFLSPLERIGAGSMTMKVAKVGLGSTYKGMKMVISKVLKNLDDRQILMLTEFLEEIMHPAEAAGIAKIA
ncbi:hypothetical protein OLMES_1084 [Oleiphilus messinensis]|uniref:Uncharacterized protein n=1 Tax=Oleiphilus messinensis TaxID=141451 RepID=A0A1Y0I4N5_9GAMM|nr:hypothetical protein [Oleiphilus messinensis]ARU55169.1 hypothetical protein OLMES_1084 [Oleiphilus messinensis]